MVQSPSNPPHAFFDYDGTLIEGDSILYWLAYYYHRRPLRRVFQTANIAGLILYAGRVISSHTLKRVFLWPLAFEKPGELDALARGFVRDDLSRRFHVPVLARLHAHRRLGHNVTVISASAAFYLRHLAELLPPGCRLLGTEMERDRGFLRFPRYRDGNLRGNNKIRRLRGLGFADAGRGGFAYSDHHHDVPLLEFVEHPQCIRPTRKLAARASLAGWPVRDWPRKRPQWKLKLEALCLLVFTWAPKFLAAPTEPSMPDEEAIAAETRRVKEEMSVLTGRMAQTL